jgi:S-adenosylmethionine-dependent methyltransferase
MSLKKFIKQILLLHPYDPKRSMGIDYYNPTKEEISSLRSSLVNDFFAHFPEPFPVHDKSELENGFSWMDDHLYHRLNTFRDFFVPFLNSVSSLNKATVMDVGCGTGASLVALAEAGAKVYGIDIDEPSLAVSEKRCAIYRSDVSISKYQATDIGSFMPGVKFDFIIFNASLEHMYLHERLASLKAAWDRLEKGGHLAVIECPNRLWYFDIHTSHLPFFEWLPHDLALLYTKFSPRKFINELHRLPQNEKTIEQFIRIGRGMSYHEIDLAIADSATLHVAGNLSDFIYSQNNWLDKYRFLRKTDTKFQKILKEKSGMNLHQAFCEMWLNFVIRKN